MGNILMIAFHFPPQVGSSGLLRTLKHCRYLPEFGWHATVLTANPRAYDKIDAKSVDSIPGDVKVIRSFAADAKKHLGIGGRYPRFLALPDRWGSWILGGVAAGFRAIRKNDIDVIYSTFPIMSAAVIGLVLQRWTALPWVLDLRDPMSDEDYPRDPLFRRVWRSIEKRCMRRVSCAIFTTELMRRKYLERYPDILTPEKCVLISNGYDEEDFRTLRSTANAPVAENGPIQLVHSGLLYPLERDPRPMFRALARLKKQGRVSAATVRIVFRAPGTEDLYRQLLAENKIEDLVVLAPHLPYQQALQECADADGLLLFQAAQFDLQIPAKAYEYLRLRKPILALTTPTGATAGLLRETGRATIVNLADEDDIYDGLSGFIQALRTRTYVPSGKDTFHCYTRRAQAGQFARVLDGLTRKVSTMESEKPEAVAS